MQQQSEHQPRVVYTNESGDSWITMTNFCDILPQLEQFAEECKPHMQYDKPIGKLYGKECFQRRGVGFFSEDVPGYFYSGQSVESSGLSENGKFCMGKVNGRMETDNNAALCNDYPNGNHLLAHHHDKDDGLPANKAVISISLGESRDFQIRENATGKLVNIPTKHGYALTMHGNFQKTHTHAIPARKKAKGGRFSITFRKHDAAIEARKIAELRKRKRDE